MDYLDAIIAVISISNSLGYPIGRTVIQKLIYFTAQKGIVKDEDTYFPHYYGPYSSEVARALSTAVSIDFVQEGVKDLPEYGGKRYVYTLTTSGEELRSLIEKEQAKDWDKLREVVTVCEKTTKLNMQIMACAAKSYYILRQKKVTMTSAEIKQTAHSLGWKLEEADIDNATTLLVELGLAKEKAEQQVKKELFSLKGIFKGGGPIPEEDIDEVIKEWNTVRE